jgi:hypothetical protein
MTSANRIIRWSTAAVVAGVAAVAAVMLCEHAYALVHAHGETGWAQPALDSERPLRQPPQGQADHRQDRTVLVLDGRCFLLGTLRRLPRIGKR